MQAGTKDADGAAPRHADRGRTMVEINWRINPYRDNRFKELWAKPAEAALDYGANAYGFYQSKEDPLHFKQIAFFDAKEDWERYWYSTEISDARTRITGLYQVPLTYAWHSVIGADERTLEGVEDSPR